MNTTATKTTAKVRLVTVVPGYYCHNTAGYAHMFQIVKQDATGLYRITDTAADDFEATVATVRTLNEARAFIASVIAK